MKLTSPSFNFFLFLFQWKELEPDKPYVKAISYDLLEGNREYDIFLFHIFDGSD